MSHYRYHVGLYVIDEKTRFYTDCTDWDAQKHDKLYKSNFANGPFVYTFYDSSRQFMGIGSSPYKSDSSYRPICFNPSAGSHSAPSALKQSEERNGFASTGVVAVGVALVATVVGLGVALLRAMKRNQKLTQELPTTSS